MEFRKLPVSRKQKMLRAVREAYGHELTFQESESEATLEILNCMEFEDTKSRGGWNLPTLLDLAVEYLKEVFVDEADGEYFTSLEVDAFYSQELMNEVDSDRYWEGGSIQLTLYRRQLPKSVRHAG